MILASIDKSDYNDASNFKSWKVLETVSNHLKVPGNTFQLFSASSRKNNGFILPLLKFSLDPIYACYGTLLHQETRK